MSLKDQAKKDCPICKGSGQDTRTTGFTAVCECVEAEESQIELWAEVFSMIQGFPGYDTRVMKTINSKYHITKIK